MQPQCEGIKTWTAPSLEAEFTVPDIYDFHLEHSPGHPVFVYAKADGERVELKWRDVGRASHRAAYLVAELVGNGNGNGGSEPAPIGLFANTDYITYTTLVTGIMRAGYPVFLLSTRNSPAIMAHLLAAKDVKYVFASTDSGTRGVVEAAVASMEDPVKVLDVPSFDSLFVAGDHEPFPRADIGFDSTALIIHSSGTTSFPKPISLKYRRIHNGATTIWNHDRDIGKEIIAIHGVPPFHLLGQAALWYMLWCGARLATFAPGLPTLGTTENIVDRIVKSKSTLLLTVPSTIEQASKTPHGLEALLRLNALLYAGGPISRAVGDMLAARGIPLINIYGTCARTEVGVLTYSFPINPGADWEWFRFAKHIKRSINWDQAVMLMYLRKHAKHPISVTNCEVDGCPAYNTHDVIEVHPTKPDLFRVIGRSDDQIMLSTGEKINPGPLENILLSDPKIASALMFGRGRLHGGVLIMPTKEFEFDPSDTGKLTEFRNAIWHTVEKVNTFAPSHSIILKEMILVCAPNKPFLFTPKGSVRRSVSISAYESEIDSAYQAFEESTQSEIDPPRSWQLAHAEAFISTIVHKAMGTSIGENDNLFTSGCDSLKATWIRNTITRALRQTTGVYRSVSPNFVYSAPSIVELAEATSSLVLSQDSTSVEDRLLKKARELESLVAQYTTEFPIHSPSTDSVTDSSGDVVLVTGTTGGLGSHLLAQLLTDSNIERVYALNRAGKEGLARRHEASFEHKGLDIQLLRSEKLVLLETDITRPRLGLSDDIYETIRTSVTHVIHNAWPVNFNFTVQTFEPSFRTVRNLIDLCLSSPRAKIPRLVFTSSIAVSMASNAPEVPITDPRTVAPTGYAQSKWVTERILQIAEQKTELKPIIVRVTQLCGGSNGAWNTTEWAPRIILSAKALGCVPFSQGRLAWIRLHEAATALLEMRNAQPKSGVLHLVNPRTTPWEEVFGQFGVPMVPYQEWLEKVKKADSSVPATVLIDFYANVNQGVLSTDEACKASPTLGKLNPIDKDDVEGWKSVWKRAGYAVD